MRFINSEMTEELLSMSECIDAVRQGFIEMAQGAYFQPLRMKAEADDIPNKLVFMPVRRNADPSLWAAKTFAVTPDNAKRGLDSHQGGVILYDGETGVPKGMVDASAITAIRTAAATAVASVALAPTRVSRVAVVGAGEQGIKHAEALRHIYPSATLSIWGRTMARAEVIAERWDGEVASSIEACVGDADVVATVTGSKTPILELGWLKPGCHLNAVGSSISVTREMDGETMAAARLFVDRRESTINESGDYLLALKEGAISEGHIVAEIGELLTGKHEGRSSDEEFTMFKSLGVGMEDLVAAELVLKKADSQNAGLELDW